MQGISTLAVDDPVNAMGGSGISKSQVSRLCEEIDERAGAIRRVGRHTPINEPGVARHIER